jgi:hypothetical protein
METCLSCRCCVDDRYHFTFGGRGPFCSECFESLSDPDHALVLAERVARLEAKVSQLQADLLASDKIIADYQLHTNSSS